MVDHTALLFALAEKDIAYIFVMVAIILAMKLLLNRRR